MESQIQMTQNIRDIWDSTKSRVLSFYAKEDFEYYLEELNTARLNGTSDFADYQRKLRNIFRARNIEYAEILDESFNANTSHGRKKINDILEQIPSREEIIAQLVQEMYNLYQNFPRAQEYMNQLVQHLTGNSNEPLRLQILKQFLLNTNYHVDFVLNTVEKILTPSERQSYHTAPNEKAKREIIAANVDDSIFEKTPYLKFSDWQIFFSRWLKNSACTPFFY